MKTAESKLKIITERGIRKILVVCIPEDQFMTLNYYNFFASHSVSTTVAWATTRCVIKFVDEVGSTVLYGNRFREYATFRTIIKAHLPLNFTIFHCRMSTLQPAWPVCTTSVCWHACCWHFCSCSSHKTIPSLSEWNVAKRCTCFRCFLFCVSIGFTQVWVMLARIDYEEKW